MKVHVWAGISMQGPTPVCIFEGIMTMELYVSIIRNTLLPFLHMPLFLSPALTGSCKMMILNTCLDMPQTSWPAIV